jgi:pimeloyl-ACP methyl ester carboxylesterase
MPKIEVNGVTLAYELFGQGPPVVWTPAGWFPRIEPSYLLAGRLSANYRVLLWDRRNTGESDVGIEDAPSDMHLMADDLHHLLVALDMSPAYLIGRCSGHTLSLLVAHRYPADVKALILNNTSSHDPALGKPILDAYFFKPAAAAEESGMEAVIALATEAWVRVVSGTSQPGSWNVLLKGWAETVLMNPGNRDRLLAMDPKAFAAIMRRWGNWYMAGPGHSHGLPYEIIRTIEHPALVLHGFDPLHPRQAAEALYQQLPNAEWVEYTDLWSQEEIDRAQEEGLATQQVALLLPFIEAFLERIESGQ